MSDQALAGQIAALLVNFGRASPTVAQAAASALLRELDAERVRPESIEVSRAWVAAR